MSYQKCPICNGTGIDPTPGTTSSTQPRCLVCNGTRIISEVTGLPPQKANTDNVKEMSTFLRTAQLNIFAEQHMKNVIDELDKAGELPYHIRPTNPLKRTEAEKDEIRMERFMDPSLKKIDEERGTDIFHSFYIKLSKEDEEKLQFLTNQPTQNPTQDVSNLQSPGS